MRDWDLGEGDPLCLIIAADARLSTPDYGNDQAWELALVGGDPPAVGIGTTYGLRARSMRIFPTFGIGEKIATDPASFAEPPRVRRFFPNYLRLEMTPLPGLRVTAEYWIPDSHSLGGRFTLANTGREPLELRVSLNAVLRPGEEPQPLREQIASGSTVLAGRTGGLHPVVFLATGAVLPASPFPTLSLKHSIEPGMGKAVLWATSACADPAESLLAAREIVGRNWDSEIARIELLNEALLEVQSGEPSWDAAFAFAQTRAIASYVGPTPRLPHPSFVLSRGPGKGYSERGDGSDHGRLWNGQPALDALSHLSVVLPGAPELAKGVLHNFLAHQGSDGYVDAKPGLAGQRSGVLAPPLLATLAAEIYRCTEDIDFVQKTLPRLADFVEAWFSPAHDRDGDGFPEWDHTLHSGFDEWPAFVRWGASGQGLDITTAETIDLASYLYRECRSILWLGKIAKDASVEDRFAQRAENLRSRVEATWSDNSSSYHHQDRDTHCVSHGELLGSGRGAFNLEMGRHFEAPVRIVVKVSGPESQRHAVQVFIHGKGGRGRHRVERLGESSFSWYWGIGTTTSARTYHELERIEVRGLGVDFEVVVRLADCAREDLGLLLPLWAGIPDPGRARRLIERTLLDPKRYWRPHGLPTTPASDPGPSPDGSQGAVSVWVLWNSLIGEGMVNYGHLDQAAQLLERIMQPIARCLRESHAFYEAYDPETSAGLGEAHHLAGLAPLGLFLRLLGVEWVSPSKVIVRGRNPFPWPVALRRLGVEVLLPPRGPIRITFADGQVVEVSEQRPQVVEQVPSVIPGAML
jgi:hypothetical protein